MPFQPRANAHDDQLHRQRQFRKQPRLRRRWREKRRHCHVSNCTLSGNTGSYGGGLYNFAGATVTLANCIVSGNSAKGGGGVFNFARGREITLTNSSLTDNSASGGIGSIYFGEGEFKTLVLPRLR